MVAAATQDAQADAEEFTRSLADPLWLATGQFTEEASSDGLGWCNGHLLVALVAAGTFGPHALGHPTLSFTLDPDAHVDTATASGQLLRPGCMTCSPDGMVEHGRLHAAARLIVLTVRRSFLDEVAVEVCGEDAPRVELVHRYDVADRCILDLVHSLAAVAVRRDHAAAGYADALLHAVAARLVYKHSNASGKFGGDNRSLLADKSTPHEGLHADEMRAVTAFVHAQMEQRLLVEDLARVCDRSAVHFSRLMKRSTGVSPHQFVLNARISEAKRLLSGSEVPISEVAARCGFSSQEHLSRRFRDATGITPAAFRNM